MTFQTVEQLQAQIASLTAENERLRGLLSTAVQQLKGCAMNHYGDDAHLHGMPSYITAMEAALQPEEPS
jgi:hypothetical protein